MGDMASAPLAGAQGAEGDEGAISKRPVESGTVATSVAAVRQVPSVVHPGNALPLATLPEGGKKATKMKVASLGPTNALSANKKAQPPSIHPLLTPLQELRALSSITEQSFRAARLQGEKTNSSLPDLRCVLDDARKRRDQPRGNSSWRSQERGAAQKAPKRSENLEFGERGAHAYKKLYVPNKATHGPWRTEAQPVQRGGHAVRGRGRGRGGDRQPGWTNDSGGPERHRDAPWDARGRGRGDERGRGARNAARGEDDGGQRMPGFRRLQEWTELDANAAVEVIANSRNGFAQLLQSELRPDIMRLVVALLAKACEADFVENKTAILAAACDSRFQSSLALHLSTVHTDEHARRREACPVLFAQLLLFCETAVALLPVTAAERLGAKLTFVSVAMENMAAFHAAATPEGMRERLARVQDRLKTQLAQRALSTKRETGRHEQLRVLPPPDDYRQLPIYPTAAEVTTKKRAFLRPNIVDGAYQSAEHYLDVQFRLLREDFVQPLREGICALAAGDERKMGTVRVYREVRFLEPTLSADRVGLVVQFQPLARMRWEQSKRLMFGSLLCFSRDNFASVLFATVMERNVKKLELGQVSVEMATPTQEDLRDHLYLMVEAEVFFAPYQNVLQALQKMPSDHFPMSRYIVEVMAQTEAPRYLRERPNFRYRIADGATVHRVYPLDDASWPTEMSLNESQREAFKAALTREFVVIQGPPGTGKTHVGLMIARTLIVNVPTLLGGEVRMPFRRALDHEQGGENNRMAQEHGIDAILDDDPSSDDDVGNELRDAGLPPAKQRSPILVVCYTNHALDQFLEGLLDTTNEIIRVGGQSKSLLMAPLNLKERRFANRSSNNARGQHVWLGRNIHAKMSEMMACMQSVHKDLQNLAEGRGIVSLQCIEMVYYHHNLGAFLNDDGWLDDDLLLAWVESGEGVEGLANLPEDAAAQVEEVQAHGENNVALPDPDEDEDEDRHGRDEMDLDRNIVVDAGITYAADFKEMHDKCRELGEQIEMEKESGVKNSWKTRQAHQSIFMKLRFYSHWLKLPQPAALDNVAQMLNNHVQLWELSTAQRRSCYEHWLRLLRHALQDRLRALEADYRREARRYEETRHMEDLELMSTAKVVGMTTTMAAKLQPLLQALRPRIVIVEEAAEVTESHIVVSLTNHCEHVILIGDHQQLRPTTATYRLARDFHLDVSLFERMLRNGLHCSQLRVQHRMRPEIARLVSPAIYPELGNHESVEQLAAVRGVCRSLFFLTHDHREQEVGETSSKRNPFEGDLVLSFCRYLLQQGYTSSQITILATYSGQMFYLKEARRQMPTLQDVKITIVDNYQGEENDIILLSLVRNNADNKIGFLSTENRVCVALSRAKQGFFIFGNMPSLVASSDIWPKIRDELEQQGALGEKLVLRCQVHPDQLTEIAESADFYKVSEGGCRLPCDSALVCGHRCKRLCHGDDRSHTAHKCMEPCSRVPAACPLQHPCPRLCHQPCGDCQVPVTTVLACGHDATLACHVDTVAYACTRPVPAVEPACGHAFDKPCHLLPAEQSCPHACDIRLECGHSCVRRCHVHDDPDHIEYLCQLECAQTNAGCSKDHPCSRRCFEPCGDCRVQVVKTPAFCQHPATVDCSLPADEIICQKACERTLPCGHPCPRKCSDICGGCQIQVKKTVDACKHTVKIACCEEPVHRDCRSPCKRLLLCGHPCPKLCRLACAKVEECEHLVQDAATLVCGHKVTLPCNVNALGLPGDSEQLLQRCQAPCETVLQCGHPCPGSCGECLQGRVHVGCKERCTRVLVCGHVCKSACAEACPPCTTPCNMRCNHSYCNQKCGVPCNPCKMKCKRRCPHVKCNKRCSQQCDCEPCEAPCTRRLAKCKHPCMGFCGEPCPPLCRVCRPEEAAEILFGSEEEPDARFVFLVDCKHSIEATGMTEWLLQDAAEIKMPRCPRCSHEIISTQRYKESVRLALDNIMDVKKRIFGDRKDNQLSRAQLVQKLNNLRPQYMPDPRRFENEMRPMFGRGRARGRYQQNRFVQGYQRAEQALRVPQRGVQAADNFTDEEEQLYNLLTEKLKTVVGKRKVNHSRSDLNTIGVKLDILIDVHESLKSAAAGCGSTEGKSALVERANRLLSSVRHRPQLGTEETQDLGLELRRFQRIEVLLRVEAAVRDMGGDAPTICARPRSVLLSQRKYSLAEDDEMDKILKGLTKKYAQCDAAVRKMIVNAMHLTQGHWFKCPNGHIYSIGECGGAMEESRCPECNATIGGSRHRLRDDNAVATEMDGATQSAFDMNVAAYRHVR